MITLKKILVPTDFSENAGFAYAYARELAEKFEATIVVVHVAEPISYPIGPGQIAVGWENLESELSTTIERNLEEALTAFDGLEARATRRDGSPFAELVRAARDEHADLIVMSTHGHTGIKHLLIGSTAEKVVRKAPCPVLTVHPGDRNFVMP